MENVTTTERDVCPTEIRHKAGKAHMSAEWRGGLGDGKCACEDEKVIKGSQVKIEDY